MQDALCSGFPLTLLTNIVNERITDGRTEQRTDGLKDGWGDGRTDLLIEMQGHT